MKRLTPTTSRILWVIHVAVTSTWLGCLVAMIALALSAHGSTSPASRATWGNVDTVENVTAAMAVTTILVGMIQGLWGGWGFARHRWILAKWLLALGIVVSGAAIVHPGARALADASGRPSFVLGVMFVQLAALVAALVLSRFKPWRAGTRPAR